MAEELNQARVQHVVLVGDVALEPQEVPGRALGHRQVLTESGQRRGVGARERTGRPRDEAGDDGGVPLPGRVFAERREHRIVAGPPRLYVNQPVTRVIGFRDNLVYALRLTRAPLVRLSSRNLCNQTRQAPYSSRWFAKAACRAILVRNRFRKAAPRASVSHAAAPVSSSSKAIVRLTKHSSL